MTDVMKPLPFIRTTRPGHVETMFNPRSRAPSLTNSHRSADSISSQTTSPTESRADVGTRFHETRALSPAYESATDMDDTSSLRSFAMSFSFKKPKWRFPFASTRRPTSSVARTQSLNHTEVLRSATPHQPRKLTSNHARKLSIAQLSRDKPLPPSPTESERTQELSCRRCYYSIARCCSGWVMGGSHGDACDACLRDGFFGSP